MKNINYQNHYDINILKYFQILQSIGLFIIAPFLIAVLFSNKPLEYLKISKTTGIMTFILACLIMFSCMPLIEWMVDINSHLRLPHQFSEIEKWMKDSESNADVVTKAFLNVTTAKGLILNLIMIGFLPALGEELLFRGLLVKFFGEWTKNKHLGIIISAFLFSAIHFQFYGFIPRMMLGILFGYLFVWSGTIWIPVFVHLLNNSTAVITSYLQSRGFIKVDVDKMFSFQNQYLYILFSLIATTVFISLFYYYTNKKLNSERRKH